MTYSILQIFLLIALQGSLPSVQTDASRIGIIGPVCKVSEYEISGPPTRGKQVRPMKRDLTSVTAFDERGNEARVEHYDEGKLTSFVEKTHSNDMRFEIEHADPDLEFVTSSEPGVVLPKPVLDQNGWIVRRAESKLTRREDRNLVGETVTKADQWSLPLGRQITYLYGPEGRLAEERILFREESAPRVVYKYFYNSAGDLVAKEVYSEQELEARLTYSDYVFDTHRNWTRRTCRSVDAEGKIQLSTDLRVLEYCPRKAG